MIVTCHVACYRTEFVVAMDGVDKRYALTEKAEGHRDEVGEEGTGGHRAQAGGGGGGGEGTCMYM